ncbi:TonB-dependent receptor [Peristeroidobacter soli]|uniref:TonB-dependent receptor n=1 Tax=Peristeroidobacter soli TaxID=2497877 RepID=UPI00158A5397|nr:TonB-dependent receptor [Peristeroidobacter soli]
MSRQHHRRLQKIAALALASPGLSLYMGAASAAEERSAQIEEIIVTAQKRAEGSSKVPISLSVYDAETLDRIGARDFNDVVKVTPGIEFSDDRGAKKNITIRGIYSQAGSATSGIYIDDVPVQVRVGILNLVGVGTPRIFDLERVEILRGPQGTLFGASAQGGAVRFITAQPSLTDFSGYSRADISSTEGGELGYEAGVSLGGPIVENKAGYRVSAWYRRDGGYIDHDSFLPGGAVEKDANWSESTVVRGALTFAPTESLRITPSMFLQKVNINDSGFFDPSASNVDDTDFVNKNALLTPADDKFYLPSLKIEADLGPVSLTALTGYMRRENDYALDYTNVVASFFGLAAARSISEASPVPYSNHQDVYSQELRLQSSDPDARLKWTVGGFYSYLRQEVHQQIVSPALPAMTQELWGMTVPYAWGADMVNGDRSFDATNILRDRQLAGFAQFDYRVLDKLTLIAGTRVARQRSGYSYNAAGPVNGGTTARSGEQEETAMTPKFGINYQVNDSNLLYASAAKGNRMGGANTPLQPTPQCTAQLQEIGVTSTPSSYDSDELWSYEVGSKNRLFGNRLAIEGSAYYIDWKDIQQSIYVPDCLASFVANVGKAEVKGFDLLVNARLTESFHLGLNVGYTDAKVAETAGVPGTNIVYAYKGDQLDMFHSPWLFAASLEYAFGLGGYEAYLRVDDQYRPKNPGPFTSLDHPGTPNYSTLYQPNPSQNILNFRAGMMVNGMELSLYVNNALNDHPFLYDLAALGVGGSALGSTFTVRPRTVGMGMLYRW